MDLGAAMSELAPPRQGVVAGRELVASGVSRSALSRAVAAGELVRLRRGAYAAAPLPPLPRFLVTETGVAPDYAAHVRAVLASLGPTAAARARTAAALRGWGLLVEPSRTVEVQVGHGRSRTRSHGVDVRRTRDPQHVLLEVPAGCRPVAVTSAVQTVVDCALELGVLEAVVVGDSALRSGDVAVESLLRAVARLPGRDARRVRRVVGLLDARTGSVLESVQRMRMVLAGVVGFDLQVVLRESPELRVDFCFREAGLVVEVDGAKWHPDPARDRARDNVLARLGWRVLRYTWAEVVHDAERVVQEVREALARTGPAAERRGGVELLAA